MLNDVFRLWWLTRSVPTHDETPLKGSNNNRKPARSGISDGLTRGHILHGSSVCFKLIHGEGTRQRFTDGFVNEFGGQGGGPLQKAARSEKNGTVSAAQQRQSSTILGRRNRSVGPVPRWPRAKLERSCGRGRQIRHGREHARNGAGRRRGDSSQSQNVGKVACHDGGHVGAGSHAAGTAGYAANRTALDWPAFASVFATECAACARPPLTRCSRS
jgi:hypothetical protein